MPGPSEFHLDEDFPKWRRVKDNKTSTKINTEVCGNRQSFGPRGRAGRTSAGGLDGLCALASSKFKVSNRFELFSHSEHNADSN